ncbi:hypothetical protein [Acetatifactor aquisgranensis]|uniref:hypothetical protein n=1 Tax=Acetatifactor aquisgranensis TaxID=2941233 RepID=UPI002041394F|nr:hypothetical protein [Acetatifactor aquisgranensis]
MSDKRKKRKPGFVSGTAVLFALAIALLSFSAIGSTRAALTFYSETYTAQIDVQSIGVSLLENGKIVGYRDYTHADNIWNQASGELLVLPEGEEWQIGKTYPEALSVRNSGSIDEYVRVKVYKYWVDKDGNKLTHLSPAMIDLHLTNDHWIVDDRATTARMGEGDPRDGETIVLYYDSPLPAAGEGGVFHETEAFIDSVTIKSDVVTKVTETRSTDADGWTTVRTVYDYDGASFVVEAEVDAVQTHNARDAIKSAWGVDVEVAGDGTLRLR